VPDIRALQVPVGSIWMRRTNDLTLQVVDHDITHEGDTLLSVRVEGGSRQLVEYDQLIKGWQRLDG
jgi:hypothetical protein